MSYVWFNMVLEALGKKLNYESISNLYGNSFAKDAAKTVQKAYPLTKHNATASLNQMIGMSKVAIIEGKTDESKKKQMQKALGGGDNSWFEEYLK